MSIELYLTTYILIALVTAITARLTILDDYDELGWASAFGVFWPVTILIAVFLIIVEKATKAIKCLKENPNDYR